ncbi:hypothetical protein NFI96_022481 [Prochilodus magdalenae]|nr:hypothetical protein NFI96_022481 [Prochilodus magdalenae]
MTRDARESRWHRGAEVGAVEPPAGRRDAALKLQAFDCTGRVYWSVIVKTDCRRWFITWRAYWAIGTVVWSIVDRLAPVTAKYRTVPSNNPQNRWWRARTTVGSASTVVEGGVPDGDSAHFALCTSEGFYPAALEQVWIRHGEFITYLNSSLTNREYLNYSKVQLNSSINTDGSHSLTSYLHLSPTTEQVLYSCWVNHSSLSQPITVNISSTECYETEEQTTGECGLCSSAEEIKRSEAATFSQVEYHIISAPPHVLTDSPLTTQTETDLGFVTFSSCHYC